MNPTKTRTPDHIYRKPTIPGKEHPHTIPHSNLPKLRLQSKFYSSFHTHTTLRSNVTIMIQVCMICVHRSNYDMCRIIIWYLDKVSCFIDRARKCSWIHNNLGLQFLKLPLGAPPRTRNDLALWNQKTMFFDSFMLKLESRPIGGVRTKQWMNLQQILQMLPWFFYIFTFGMISMYSSYSLIKITYMHDALGFVLDIWIGRVEFRWTFNSDILWGNELHSNSFSAINLFFEDSFVLIQEHTPSTLQDCNLVEI